MLAHSLSSLPHLETTRAFGAIKLAVMVHTYCHNLFTPTLHSESLSVFRNNIGDRGGFSLAKALSINKGLERLYLDEEPTGREDHPAGNTQSPT